MSSDKSKAEALLKKIQEGTKVIDWDDFKSNGASVSYGKSVTEGGTEFYVKLNLYNNPMHNSIEIYKSGSKVTSGYANAKAINGAHGLKATAQAKILVDDGAKVRWVKSNSQPRSFYINYIYQEYNGGKWHTGMRLGGKTYYPELHLHKKSQKESDKIRFKQKGSRKWEPGGWSYNTAAFKNAFKHTKDPKRPRDRAMIEYDNNYDDVASGYAAYYEPLDQNGMRYDDSLNIGYINDDAWIVGMSAVLAGVVCLGLLCLVCCAVGGIAGWMATKWSETGKNERREVAEYISDEV